MSRTIVRTAALWTAVCCFSAAALFARQPLGPDSSDPTGKYALSGGGYLVVSVDDLGRAEGFYERNGLFGQLSGKLDSGVISATWIQKSGAVACEESVKDTQSWGRVTLTATETGELELAWGACGAAPTELETGR